MVDYFGISSNTDVVSCEDQLADRFGALASVPRLKLVRLLLSALPNGMIVGELQQELGMAGSTLSHHLEKLKSEGLVRVTREGTALRYRAEIGAFQELLQFLMAECCSRQVVEGT